MRVVPDGCMGPESVDLVGDAGDGVFVTYQGPPPMSNDALIDFTGAFREMWGEIPGAWSPFYYSGIYVFAEAIERAGTTDRDAVIAAVRETDFTGPVGRIRFDEKQRRKDLALFIYELHPERQVEHWQDKFDVVWSWEGSYE